jgi:hypothetical protein
MLSELPRRPDKAEQVFEIGRKHVASDFVVDAWLTGLREVGPAEGAEAEQISFIAFMTHQGVQIGEHLAAFAFIVDGDTRTSLFRWLRMQSRARQEPAETVWDSARARCTYVHGDRPEPLIVHVAAE